MCDMCFQEMEFGPFCETYYCPTCDPICECYDDEDELDPEEVEAQP